MRRRNQQAISARIHKQTLLEMDMETQVNPAMKRNTILNEGAKLWCYLQDTRRRVTLTDDPEVQRAIVAGFAKLFFPELLTNKIIIK